MANPPIQRVAGRNGVIELYEDKLKIVRGGCLSLGVGGKGETVIHYSKLSGVRWKEPTITTNGFIQLLHAGSPEYSHSLGSMNDALAAARDRNAVMFTRKERDYFYSAKEFIENRIETRTETSTGGLEAIEKLAELKSKGLITEQEFEQKKRQILGL